MPDMTSGDGFPDYRTPPVAEVIFAVSLRPLATSIVDLARFGLENLGDEYPIHQDQPAVQMATETFDGTVQNVAPTLALLTGPGGPPVRLWFQSTDKTRLIQLQRDWIAYNWQAGSGENPYPRYRAIEEQFFRLWDGLSDFLRQYKDETLAAYQCELSYINHIVPGGLWERHGQLGKVIRLAGAADTFLPEPEDGQLAFRYRISRDGTDIGRLYVQSTSGQRQADRLSIIQLTMTARGRPISEGREGALAFFRLAHEWIVNGFAAVTTDEAQRELWGRIDGLSSCHAFIGACS
jgi:uncharacterized protein (TIGR04255 family)